MPEHEPRAAPPPHPSKRWWHGVSSWPYPPREPKASCTEEQPSRQENLDLLLNFSLLKFFFLNKGSWNGKGTDQSTRLYQQALVSFSNLGFGECLLQNELREPVISRKIAYSAAAGTSQLWKVRISEPLFPTLCVPLSFRFF